jgi:hypothetical protein
VAAPHSGYRQRHLHGNCYGQILGPNIAASILAAGLGYQGVFVMCAIASLLGMLIYLFMYLRLRKTIPALADAS